MDTYTVELRIDAYQLSPEQVSIDLGLEPSLVRHAGDTPLVFTPFKHGGRLLVDGAVINPVPIAPTLDDATDLTIAAGLSGDAEDHPVPPHSESLISDDSYRRRIRNFINRRASSKGVRRDLHISTTYRVARLPERTTHVGQLRDSTRVGFRVCHPAHRPRKPVDILRAG